MDKAVIRVLLARKPYPDFEAENNKQGAPISLGGGNF